MADIEVLEEVIRTRKRKLYEGKWKRNVNKRKKSEALAYVRSNGSTSLLEMLAIVTSNVCHSSVISSAETFQCSKYKKLAGLLPVWLSSKKASQTSPST